jgi:hypothetical protein
MQFPKVMINWKPEGRKKRGHPRSTWKDGIYTAMSERGLRTGEWNNRRQWNAEVGRRRQTFQNCAIFIYLFTYDGYISGSRQGEVINILFHFTFDGRHHVDQFQIWSQM